MLLAVHTVAFVPRASFSRPRPAPARIYGEHPSLTDLDHGDLRFAQDFRSVYATVIEKWLGRDPAAVLGGRYPTLAFV